MSNQPQAVVLLSGGLDSATVLAIARKRGFACHALSFDYGQRHAAELQAARRIAEAAGVVSHRIVSLDLRQIGGSALTDETLEVPVEGVQPGIPVTYVPARNMIFFSCAVGLAEVVGARHVFTGVNAIDYSGYPDCRPEFLEAFEMAARLGTRAGTEGAAISLKAPLINMSKAEIIRTGHELGVDYSLTVSCYQADEEGRACGVCDACRLRRKGFEEAGVPDPTPYQEGEGKS